MKEKVRTIGHQRRDAQLRKLSLFQEVLLRTLYKLKGSRFLQSDVEIEARTNTEGTK